MTIFYKLHDKIYANITNKCSCDCIFCLRQSGDSVGSADSLRLSREPDLEGIKAAFDAAALADMTEIVFCGFGEPLERAAEVIETAKYIRSKSPLPIRVNTNGLVRLVNPDFDISLLSCVDTVSISLNAENAEEYLRLCRPRFGLSAYQAMLDFAKDTAAYTNVMFTIVDNMPPEQIEGCKAVAAEAGVPLRIRPYVEDNASHP